jgi:nucleotide-binding universal stress UspA family protein
MLKKALITLDGSNLSEAVLPFAVQLLAGTGVRVRLLAVAPEPKSTAAYQQSEPLVTGAPAPGGVIQLKPPATVETRTQAISRVTEELQGYLLASATPLEVDGILCETAVRFGEAAEEILRYATAEDVDLIIMATHGHTGLGRLVFGSVASRVLGAGVCPVLLVRPEELAHK